jgi:protease-4
VSNGRREKKRGSFFDILKNLFWLLIILQFAPVIIANLKNTFEDIATPKAHIGYLNVNGIITDSTYYIKNIKKFLKTPYIKGLLVKIDSPGGLPGSAQTIFNEIKKFREKKPAVAFIENVGTSAAYNVAIGCSYVVCAPSALVGSIGVWLQVPPNVQKLAEDWKIKFRNIQSGKYKTSGSPFKPMTEEEKKLLQSVSDDSYNQFVKDVAQNRGLSAKNHTKWADGKVFTGNQAFKLKLVDKVGSRQDAIDKLKKEAMIDREIKLVRPRRKSKFMRLFGEDDYDSDPSFSSMVSSFIADVFHKTKSKLQAS